MHEGTGSRSRNALSHLYPPVQQTPVSQKSQSLVAILQKWQESEDSRGSEAYKYGYSEKLKQFNLFVAVISTSTGDSHGATL